MNIKNKSLAQIHLAVFLFGLSGMFGKLIILSPMIIVFGRVLFSSAFLLFILIYFKKSLRLNQRSHYFYLMAMGGVLSVHWITFFKSIQISTIAVGLITFSTFPVFVAFLEPYFLKEKMMIRDVLTALITFIGVMVVLPRIEISSSMTRGALWGIVSGFTYAVLSILNRRFAGEYSSLVISFYEQLTSAIVLFPFVLLQKTVITEKDLILLILLGVVFTGISHSLFINGLRHIKAQVAGIISSLEPVYGIIFASLILSEVPTLREVLGGVIILGTGIYTTIRSN